MTTITLSPQLSERIAIFAAQTGKTQEQVIAAAVEQYMHQERAIPELSPRDEAMLRDIESKTDYTIAEFYQRWGIETP
ncbi:hypothetical protein [Alysiella crassa]|uniref:CopG family transcriptional regulator n=1 Tax=Alysiella crassa TaxID=153491 RepID=A0A376BKI8_9NEIS|nr:hypothetical protein [Alysiella crassa]UOP07636.1 hypothetical protein LVJ80_04515 [Alysiella crassa]SSY70135.1 Uncharacterised protein [Alysiella crassa]